MYRHISLNKSLFMYSLYRNLELTALTIFIISVFVPTIPAVGQNAITIGDVSTLIDEKLSGSINVAIGTEGPEFQVPFTIINGVNEGPVIALTADLLDRDNPPFNALQEIIESLDPKRLSGTVIVLNSVTTSSFLRRKIYHNPFEGLNLNRVYPGKASGSIGERITYRIREEIIDRSDYLIDFHCIDVNEGLIAFVSCPNRGNPFVVYNSRDLAYSMGLDVVLNKHYTPHDPEAAIGLGYEAFTSGKPSITVVAGEPAKPDLETERVIIEGITNVLMHLEMIEGKPDRTFGQIWVQRISYLKSELSGDFIPLVDPGALIQRGDVVGHIQDSMNSVVQKITAPHDGIVHFIQINSWFEKGSPLVAIGELAQQRD